MPKLPKSARPEGDGQAPEPSEEKPQPRTSGKRKRGRRGGRNGDGGNVAVAERDFERRRVDDAGTAPRGGTKAAKTAKGGKGGKNGKAGETLEQPALKKS